jgi:hypothetical protein
LNRALLIGAAAIIAFSGVTLPQSLPDRVIVPGQRVGPIAAGTVRADLTRLFPGAAIEDDEIELDEGLVQPATLVDKSNPSDSLAIVWNGKGAEAHPKQIFICRGRRRGPCNWHTPDGISDGTRHDELEKRNGRPFTISGFGMNYGGNVQSWDGGKLEAFECSGRLTLTLDGERERGGRLVIDLTPEERHSLTGDKPVASSTPAMRRVNPAVTEMVYYFAGPESKPCVNKPTASGWPSTQSKPKD